MSIFWNTLRINNSKKGMFKRGQFLTISPTMACNLDCSYCPNKIKPICKENNQVCKPEEWIAFFKNYPEWISLVAVCGGEPTIYKGLDILVNWLLNEKHHVLIYTNLYNPKALLKIKKTPMLYIQATYHKSYNPNKFKEAYDVIKKTGYNIEACELTDKRVFGTTTTKQFLTHSDIIKLNSFHCPPSAPRRNIVYIGAEDKYAQI